MRWPWTWPRPIVRLQEFEDRCRQEALKRDADECLRDVQQRQASLGIETASVALTGKAVAS